MLYTKSMVYYRRNYLYLIITFFSNSQILVYISKNHLRNLLNLQTLGPNPQVLCAREKSKSTLTDSTGNSDTSCALDTF